MYKIVRREAFSDTTFLCEVAVPDVAKSAEPGHFVMLRLHEGGERIPLKVADFKIDRAATFAGVERKPEDPARQGFCNDRMHAFPRFVQHNFGRKPA